MMPWRPIGPSPQIDLSNVAVSGRVLSMAWSPSLGSQHAGGIFLGIDGGGIWRWKMSVSTDLPLWEPLTDHLPIPIEQKKGLSRIVSLDLDRNNWGTLYASTGGGVLKTTDGGDSWQLATQTPIARIHVDPRDASGNTLYGLLPSGVVLSRDGGSTWQNPGNTGLPASMTPHDLEYVIDYGGSLRLLLGIEDGRAKISQAGIYVSDDFGFSWERMLIVAADHETGGVFTLDQIGQITLAADHTPGTALGMYAAICHRTDKYLLNVFSFMQQIEGQGWAPISGVSGAGGLPASVYLQGGFDQPLAISPTGLLYLGISLESGHGGLYMMSSLNQWVELVTARNGVFPHVDSHAILLVGETVYFGTDGGVFRFLADSLGSATGTWQSLNNGSLQTHLALGIGMHTTDANQFLIGSQDNGAAYTRSGPVFSTPGKGPGDCGLVRFDPIGGSHCYAVGNDPSSKPPNYLFRSDDDLSSPWLNWKNPGFYPESFYPPVAIDPTDTRRIAFGLAQIWQTLDRGDSWSVVSDLPPPPSDATAIAYSTDGSRLYVAYRSVLWMSASNLAAGKVVPWVVMAQNVPGTITGIATDPQTPNRVVIATDQGAIQLFEPSQDRWIDLTQDYAGLSVWSLAVYRAPRTAALWIFVGSDVGVWTAKLADDDSQVSWFRFGATLPDAQVADLQISAFHRRLGAALVGRGGWVTSLALGDFAIVDIEAVSPGPCQAAVVQDQPATLRAVVHNMAAPFAFHWTVDGAATAVGPTDQKMLTATWPAGQFRVSVLVTDANGETTAAAATVRAIDPLLAAILEALCMLRERGGFSFISEQHLNRLRRSGLRSPTVHDIELVLGVPGDEFPKVKRAIEHLWQKGDRD